MKVVITKLVLRCRLQHLLDFNRKIYANFALHHRPHAIYDGAASSTNYRIVYFYCLTYI